MPESQKCQTLGRLFIGYAPKIEDIFKRVVEEGDLAGENAPRLEFTETGTRMLFRCVPSERIVLADWRGIASLWAMSQAMGRLAPAMFDARRRGAERLDLTEGTAEELGLQLIGYAKELSETHDWQWNLYFPKPDVDAQFEEARTGDVFFFRSIEWIFRHELSHIVLGHTDRPWGAEQSWAEERAADLDATRSIKGGLAVELNRTLGERASTEELELERRALATGIGLIWVALYEDTRTQKSDLYPPIADRMFRCLDVFSLAEDSAVFEILSDFVKAWIDPQGEWGRRHPSEATSQAAMIEAYLRLDGYARAIRS